MEDPWKSLWNQGFLYKNSRIGIPAPEFYVFYNGPASYPTEKILRLSDAYLEKDREHMLELTVKVININLSANHPLLKHCRPVYEYSWFIQKIRTYTDDGMSRDQAIIAAMEDCRNEGILLKFLREHGSEASNMLFTEFNMEDALEVRGEEKYEEGRAEGIAEGIAEGKAGDIIELLSEYGEIPDDIKNMILEEKDLKNLGRFLRLAAKAGSLEAFAEAIK